MHLELQLSAFFGYGKNDTDSYLGLQAHGVLWVADPTHAPVNWPIAPPIVAGKVGTPSQAQKPGGHLHLTASLPGSIPGMA